MNKLILIILSALFASACVTNYAKEGYTNQADYQLAQQWGNSRPTQHGLDLLKSKGITTKAQFDAVVNEMNASSYPSDPNVGSIDAVIYYLNDKQVAQTEKISILNARNKRIAQQKAENEKAEANEARKKQEYAKEFPYLLVISCEYAGVKLDVVGCFSGKNRIKTELEVRNGSEYQMYQVYDLNKAGKKTSDGLVIPLRSHFMVKAQNAYHYILTFTVYQTATMQQVYKNSAPMFGIVKVSN